MTYGGCALILVGEKFAGERTKRTGLRDGREDQQTVCYVAPKAPFTRYDLLCVRQQFYTCVFVKLFT